MRSYKQYCALAKALDVVGDRWSLLIIRELLIREMCRYTDLLSGLPGIATNLLARRLDELEKSGVIRRRAAPPPVATTVFELTQRGQELERVILLLGQWGGPLLGQKAPREFLRAHWIVLALKLHLTDRHPARSPIAIELRAGQQPITVEISKGKIDVRLGTVPAPDATISGAPDAILQLLAGKIQLSGGDTARIQYRGDKKILRRLAWKDSVPSILPKIAQTSRALPEIE